MQVNYIIDGQNIHEEEFEGIEKIHDTAHRLLDEHKANSIDCITQNSRITINRPKNG